MNVLDPKNMENTTHLHHRSPPQPPEQPTKTPHPNDEENSGMETRECNESSLRGRGGAEEESMTDPEVFLTGEDDNGRVWIPEIWGQEELLKDWIHCSGFDDSLVPRGIMSARTALVEEGRRANINGGFRIENSC
ncbi:protein BIC1-like [Hibiscus syriacus]|uniref:protein BIC1-like n=1 Tax=Hibiscus syriacus TaxID=106335 RepID=UPI00192462C9|nr:protein BIC1-like [Hibiscus syriacus]